jgi:Uma2 family endonuclease
MSLAEFDEAETEEGCILELSRGIIVVSNVPTPRHAAMVDESRFQIDRFRLANPGRVRLILGGGECKFFLPGWESERHPDLAVYTTPYPRGKNVWARWIPAVALEIVSLGSEERDYVLKKEEYLEFGIKEYWILDPERRELCVLYRVRNRWKEEIVTPPQKYTCRILPGLEFDCAAVFQAAEEV